MAAQRAGGFLPPADARGRGQTKTDRPSPLGVACNIVIIGHRHGLVTPSMSGSSLVSRNSQGFLLEDLVSKHHEAVAKSETTPENSELQVQAVVAWTRLQQAREQIKHVEFRTLASTNFITAVRKGPSAVQKWISTNSTAKSPTLKVVTMEDSQKATDFRSDVARLDPRCPLTHDQETISLVDQIRRRYISELAHHHARLLLLPPRD